MSQYDFSVKPWNLSTFPLFVPHPRHGEPMAVVGLWGCHLWLRHFRLDGQLCDPNEIPDETLLLLGLRQGRLLEAGHFAIGKQTGILFTLPDRQPRFVTAAQFCLIRLLALPGGDCVWWFDRSTRKELPDEEQRWYLRYSHSLGIWGLRILAEAHEGEAVYQRVKKEENGELGHKNLTPANLIFRPRPAVLKEGKKMRHPYRGRAYAIDFAVKCFGNSPDYRGMLTHACAVVDAELAAAGLR
jgi:hypothetical protein